MKTPVQMHFDSLADQYDDFKKRNWYYYHNLTKALKQIITDNRSVMEIGCGTGSLLKAMNPRNGLGIDISHKMIEIAQKKHAAYPNLDFRATTIEQLNDTTKFDYIFLADVIEHLENATSTFQTIRKYCEPRTNLIITMGNPLWEPVMMILENLRMKMPEGPHYRLSIKQTIKLLDQLGFEVSKISYHHLFPVKIPLVSKFFNKYLIKMPLIKNLGIIIILQAKIK